MGFRTHLNVTTRADRKHAEVARGDALAGPNLVMLVRQVHDSRDVAASRTKASVR
jgi:hypothetical protein